MESWFSKKADLVNENKVENIVKIRENVSLEPKAYVSTVTKNDI